MSDKKNNPGENSNMAIHKCKQRRAITNGKTTRDGNAHLSRAMTLAKETILFKGITLKIYLAELCPFFYNKYFKYCIDILYIFLRNGLH